MSTALEPPRAVLLDLGYTLVRWEVADNVRQAGHGELLAWLTATQPGPEPPADLLRRVDQHVLAAARVAYARDRHAEVDNLALFAAALAEHGYTVSAEQTRELVDREHAAFARHLTVAPATLAALATLRAQGLRLGLVSNAYTPGALMRRTLDALGLAGYLDAAVFSSEIGVRKPHPRIYETVLDALGVQPHDAVFVGDRVREDVEGPAALGMRTVLSHEYRQEALGGARPDAVLEAFAELPALIDRLRTTPRQAAAPQRRMT
jgi:putative hydrolase of the HAD superfamily